MASPPSYTASPTSVYERLTSGCTRLIAHQMVQTIQPPITTSSYILDNACGPGIVSEQIKLLHPDAKILAADLAPSMLDEVQEKAQAKGWTNVETATLDNRNLSILADGTFTHVLSNFGGPFPDDPDGVLQAVKEAFRVLNVGGVVMMSTWADRVWPAAFARVALTVRPDEAPKNAFAIKPECLTASWLASQLEQGGFGNDIEVRQVVTSVSAPSLDELVENMMLAPKMFFAGYGDEELRRAKELTGGELRKMKTFEMAGDGGVRIGMKAWIGIGWKKRDVAEGPLELVF